MTFLTVYSRLDFTHCGEIQSLLVPVNPAFVIRGPTWSLRFYFPISQNRGLQVVRIPRGFLPSKIQIWMTTTSDSLSAALVLTRAPVCVRPGQTRVRAIGNGDQSPSNRGRTMRVAPPESGRSRESYCCHPRCLSSPMSRSERFVVRNLQGNSGLQFR